MKKKSLIMLLSAMLVIATAAMGTIAYLTDSKNITNTFTVGNVIIKLDETAVNPDGTPKDSDNDGTPDGRKEEGNEYHLIPGETYQKDPMVSVQGKSEESYIRMLVNVEDMADVVDVFGEDFELETIIDGYDSQLWVPAGKTMDPVKNVLTYEFRYHTTVSTMDIENTEFKPLEPLFTSFTIPGFLTGEDLQKIAEMKIEVIGQAVQAATFEAEGEKTAADVAWEAFTAQTQN